MSIIGKDSSSQETHTSATCIEVLGRSRSAIIRRLDGQIGSKLDVIAAVILVLVVAVCAFVREPIPVFHTAHLGFDNSYMIDMAYKTEQHTWLGRDTAFTYGPVYQMLWGLSSQIHRFSLGSFFRFGHLLPFCYTTGLIFGFSFLLLRGCPSWKRALYIIGLMFSWTYFEVRQATVLFLFALSLHQFDRIVKADNRTVWRASVISLLLVIAFCISADTGVYSLAGFGLAALAFLICFRKNIDRVKKIVRFTAAGGAFFVLGAIILSALLGLRFWRDSLAVMSGYRWAMPNSLHMLSLPWLVGATALICLGFAAGWLWRRDSEESVLAHQSAFLISAPLLSLLHLQSGMVRADSVHVLFGFFPGIALAAAVIVGFCRRWFTSIFPTMAVFVFLAFYNIPFPTPFLQKIVTDAIRAHDSPSVAACPANTSPLDGVCFDRPSFNRLSALSQYIDSHTRSSDPVFIFPWENLYGVVARRRVAGGVLQNYAATGDVLVRRHLESIDKDKPPLAVYSEDEIGWRLDRVANLTRNPETWLYLQSHYSTAKEISPGVLVLRRDTSRFQRWEMHTRRLWIVPAANYVKVRGTTSFDVSRQVVSGAEVDLIRIQLLIHYPFSWHFRKPWWVEVVMDLGNGRQASTFAVVPPNRPAEIWASPWEPRLGNYFSPNSADWHPGLRPAVRGVRIALSPVDRISVKPSSVSVRGLDAVMVSLAPSQAGGAGDK